MTIWKGIVSRAATFTGHTMCFVAGTKIHTADGLKNIEEIVNGDLVLSRHDKDLNLETTPTYQPVVATMVSHPEAMCHIQFRNEIGETETVTGSLSHPFFVIEKQEFVPAVELNIGNTFTLADGNTAFVTGINLVEAEEEKPFTTYNFEVADFHTYFTGVAGVWVHNNGKPCAQIAEFLIKQMDEGMSLAQAEKNAARWIRQLKKRTGIADDLAQKHIDDILKILAKSSSRFTNAVELALKSANRGERLEGKVGKHLLDKLVDFQRKFLNPDKSPLGEIDVEIAEAIIEVTTRRKGKLKQITKYLTNKAMNPSGKPVIIYAPHYKRLAIQTANKAGAHVVKSLDELDELLKKLARLQNFK